MIYTSVTAKKMILVILSIFVIILISGILYYKNIPDIFSFGKGLTLGIIISAIKVGMLEKTIDKVLNMEEKQAQNYATLAFLFRLFMSSIVLVYAGMSGEECLWGAIIGLFSLQISACIVNLSTHKKIKEI